MEKNITLESLLERIEFLEKENRSLKGKKAVANTASSFPVNIGCNLIQGVSLSSPNGDVDAKFAYGDVVMLSSDDVAQVLKSGDNRNLFVNGLMYFEDESNYEQFSIKRKHNINRDVIRDLVMSNDINKIEEFFNTSTRKKLDATMTHTIFYTIVSLNVDGGLDGMRFETREFIEKYFSMELKMAGRLYSDLRNITV